MACGILPERVSRNACTSMRRDKLHKLAMESEQQQKRDKQINNSQCLSGNQVRNTDSNNEKPKTAFFFKRGVLVLSLLLIYFRYKNFESFSSTIGDSRYAVCSPPRTKVIFTVDAKEPQVACFAVRDSRIVDIGSHERLEKSLRHCHDSSWLQCLYDLISRRHRLHVYTIKPGHIVVPGLADAHAHVLEYGFMKQLDLIGSTSTSDVVKRIKAYLLTHPDILEDPTRWIEGMGWDQTKWAGGEFPTAADFDKEPLLIDRLIVLRRVDGHAMWVSKSVIKLIENIPEEIEGGKVVKDKEGNPTGVFVDNAMTLIPVPEWTDIQMEEYFDITIREALANGLTSIHDAATKLPMINFFKRKAEKNELPLRLYLMGNDDVDFSWIYTSSQLHNYGSAGHLNFRSVKLFADGALGSWGAAMLEPYTDNPEASGTLLHTRETLSEWVKNFTEEGLQVNIHCIGDRANHIVLDIMEDILTPENITQFRPRIEHAQIMTTEDLGRIAKLGIIPSVQPTHATSDMLYVEDRLGPNRMRGAYAYRTLLETSQRNIMPLGSDFPVEAINPLLGFYAAVTRLSVNGDSPHGQNGWYANERISRPAALKGMTYDAAYASFMENELGSITPGKYADFVVLDTDIMNVPSVSKILDTKVVATVVGGKVVFGTL